MTTGSDARRGQSMMAAVNDAIDHLHHSLDLADSDFFCECGDRGCKERITLSRAEYASWREESRPLLVVAHADRGSSADSELRELRGQVHQFRGTLASRVNIEQAKGVLVERHGMTPDEAFETLRQRARNQHRSLDEVCADVIARAGTLDIDRSSEREPSVGAPQQRRERHRR